MPALALLLPARALEKPQATMMPADTIWLVLLL